jgi:hypothetical protein
VVNHRKLNILINIGREAGHRRTFVGDVARSRGAAAAEAAEAGVAVGQWSVTRGADVDPVHGSNCGTAANDQQPNAGLCIVQQRTTDLNAMEIHGVNSQHAVNGTTTIHCCPAIYVRYRSEYAGRFPAIRSSAGSRLRGPPSEIVFAR